ncbi:MAG TPA: hypothetical protein VN661_09185 [Candidatus Acidoferrales bacterium]|nr:hypothetical protein [Candidatus Acidoferrales bacterium]
MKLRLNLSATPPPNQRPFLLGAFLIGAVSIALLVILSHAAFQAWGASSALRANTAHWQQQIAAERAKQASLAAYFDSPAAKQVLSRSEFLNSLIGQRSFPWTKIFVDLEKTLPPGVRIISISPTLDKGRAKVKLTFGAATNDGKIKFLRALEQSNAFSDVEVAGEKPANKQNERQASSDRVEVELTAWYATI